MLKMVRTTEIIDECLQTYKNIKAKVICLFHYILIIKCPVIIVSVSMFPSPFQVMLGGKNVEDGFGIAFRVLQV